ncbi:polysaccharide deacetylase family protein [Azohydromonas australica]|uniref:polysaccharide deacetylase family protein n=1 Tax=Azohydromonas australica TaxID=364039 RepID=UPI00048F53F4|nr:polysaccharide deacetylase family protein [Azohydromonas australica]
MGMLDLHSLRIDRLLTLSLVAPMSRLLPPARCPIIPVLMYHSVAPDLDSDVHPYFRTVTSPRSFARQVEFLKREGYEAVTMSEAARLLRQADTDASSAWACKVVLTFDDGLLDFLTMAFPVLESADFTATVFITSGCIGKPFLNGRPCLGKRDIQLLSQRGIEFGSHSVTHRRLVDLDWAEVTQEVVASKKTIEDIVGREVSLFSYPYRFPEENAAFTCRLREVLIDSGYSGGVTTVIGRPRAGDDVLFLPRLPMNDCDDAALLRAKLAGHYDWLHAGQLMRKKSRTLLRNWRPA